MLIDRKQFEHWADTPEAKSGMAELVSQLVMNTLPNDGSKWDIPIGSATFLGGWDGTVYSISEQKYVPQGNSGWEFGARNDFQTKANEDYKKRTDKIEEAQRLNMTFVFVTPYYWSDKDKWAEKKKAEGKWKDVRVYDSVSLSQWMYMLPIAAEWFAKIIGLTDTGLVLPKAQWEEITTGPNGIILKPRFYTAGRERIVDMVMNLVEGKPGLQAFRASSREEAMAFVLAAGQLLPEPSRSKFMGKTVVVDSKETLRRMARSVNAINIVTHLEDNSSVYAAAAKNIVFVALGPGDEFRQDVIDLPVPERHALVEELVSYGIKEPEANRIVLTNTSNLTLIRKELGFPPAGVKWMEKEDIGELKPALLLSRWNENYEDDTKLFCSVAGIECNKCVALLGHWVKQPVSPLTKTGPVWRLTSPLMLWSEMAGELDGDFFDKLKDAFQKVFAEGTETKYSSHLKEGLLQTLIIVALYGDRLRLPIGEAQTWVDTLLKSLLHEALPEKWVEFSKYLPLVAEAAPKVFVEEVMIAIKEHKPVVAALFEKKNGFVAPHSHHTSLLWALEALAWHPDYLEDVTRILLKLTEMDPGGRLSNRPFNSLVDIYLPWKPHTSVGLEGRLAILDRCLKDGFSVMWRLLIAMLPHPGSSTSGTYKLKWRDYEFVQEQGYDPSVVYRTTEWAVTRLISTFDGEDGKLASLIQAMEPVFVKLRHQIIMWLPEAVKVIKGGSAETRKALRETLWYQNLTGIKDRYVLTEEEVGSVKTAYDYLTPADLKEKYAWLFDNYYPHLPEKAEGDEEDIYENARETEKQRKAACRELLEYLGEDGVLEMRKMVKEPQTLGNTLAIFNIPSITVKVCRLLGSEEEVKFIRGYISSLEGYEGEDFFENLYGTCKNDGFSKDELTALLLCFDQSIRLWKFIETLDDDIQKAYWQRVQAVFWGGYKEDVTLYKIRKLSQAGRGLDAMNNSWIYAKEMPTEFIQDLLKDVLRSDAGLNESLDHHPLSVYIEQLHERGDADRELLLHLEWMYLPVLRYDRGNKDCLALLNERLCSDPEFVVELLGHLYKPDDAGNEEEKEPTEVERANALRAFYLFNQWKKIPGVDDKGKLDEKVLSDWIHAVIDKASECGQLKHAYYQLGSLLAHYPERKDEAEKLFTVMEPIEDKAFYTNYNAGLFNKRGFTSRGPYEGGDIERGNVETFKGLYEKYHKRFPRVSKVFKDLFEQYERMAREMDDEAEITKLDY